LVKGKGREGGERQQKEKKGREEEGGRGGTVWYREKYGVLFFN
jgi:hypothetical protein